MAGVSPGRARCLWQQTNASSQESADLWPDLRAHLSSNRTEFIKLRAALESPGLVFPVNYSQGFNALLPHLAPLKSAAQRLSVATVLDLHDGSTDEAWKDLRALVLIPVRLRDEPYMISQLVRIAVLSIAASATWEALQFNGWNEEQLFELQQLWESVSLRDSAELGISMERACVLDTFEQGRNDLTLLNGTPGPAAASTFLDDFAEVVRIGLDDPAQGWAAFMDRYPRTWLWKPLNSFYDEEWFLQSCQMYLVAAREVSVGAVYAEVKRGLDAKLAARGAVPEQFLVSRLGFDSSYGVFVERLAVAETQRRLVVTAIALKRFHLAHGEWPLQLADLVPHQLSSVPIDPMSGLALRYQSSRPNEPLLYSVGVDGVDDNGDARNSNTQSTRYWMRGRDYVWPLIASRAEVEEFNKTLEAKRSKRRQ